jgi:hypothetical protein
VGLGRNYADQVQATLSLGVPVEGVWLVSPEITWLKQGEGNLRAPFPTEADLAATPTFFIGTPTTTWRFGLGVSGQKGSFGLKGTGGLHAISNNGHVEGSSTTRFEGRIQMTIGFSTGGPSKGRQ